MASTIFSLKKLLIPSKITGIRVVSKYKLTGRRSSRHKGLATLMTQSIGRSKAAKSRKVEISFHSDSAAFSAPADSFHPAINVKVRNCPYVDAPEHITAAAYNQTVERFWQSAGILAVEHEYSGVFSEGRSDGWLVPYTQHDSTGKLVTHWTGQGPDKSYPVYPDVENKTERRQFIKFRESIENLLRESLAYYVELAGELAGEGQAN